MNEQNSVNWYLVNANFDRKYLVHTTHIFRCGRPLFCINIFYSILTHIYFLWKNKLKKKKTWIYSNKRQAYDISEYLFSCTPPYTSYSSLLRNIKAVLTKECHAFNHSKTTFIHATGNFIKWSEWECLKGRQKNEHLCWNKIKPTLV